MRLTDCLIVDLQHIRDARGALVVMEGPSAPPFAIQRVFHVFGLAPDAVRGGHAHKTLQEFVVCLKGSFDVALHDGWRGMTVTLDAPQKGLLLPPAIWRSLSHFSRDAHYMVLASDQYDASDYIHDFDEFCRIKTSA